MCPPTVAGMATTATAAPGEPSDPAVLVELVRRHTTLTALGDHGTLRGDCPFCSSTMFRVQPTRGAGIYFCLSCGDGGGAETFAAKVSSVS